MAISEAKKQANKKWDAENRDKINYSVSKSHAKKFIKIAIKEDLEMIKDLIKEREKNENIL